MPKCDIAAVETVCITVSSTGQRSAVICAAYRPPDAPVSSSLECLQSLLLELKSLGKPLFVLGDMNFNVLNAEKHETKRYQLMLQELDLNQLISSPTHLYPTPTALDHAITNLTTVDVTTRVLQEDISDHLPIMVQTSIPKTRPIKKERVIRPWHRTDWNSLCLDIMLADWTELEVADDVNNMVAIFMEIWDDLINKHCPERVVKTGGSPRCPWIQEVPGLREAMSEREAARAEWYACRSRLNGDHRDSEPPAELARYRQLRNQVKSLLSRGHQDFNCRQLLTKNHKGFWSTLRKFYKGSGNEDGGELPIDPDVLNEHFSSVGARIASSLLNDDTNEAKSPARPTRVCAAQFQLVPATIPELSAAVRDMSNSNAVGIDGIPLIAVRKCLSALAPILLRIINKSLVSGVFPTLWKTACVVPIHKSGDPTSPGNYRPISLLSVLSKITEKIVCGQLMKYLCSNSILSDTQYAYRPCHSTEDAMLDFINHVHKNMDDGLVTSVTAIDLSKAFDSVHHGLLLEKLGWYGVSPHWFASYLNQRRQTVRGGTGILPVTHGVPQGSLVGPLLFSMFTNDLSNFIPHGKLISYADDTQIIDECSPTSSNLVELKGRAEETLRELQSWFRRNSLKMNASKTDFILIGTKNSIKQTADFRIQISETLLAPSKTIKILGILVDQTLSWEHHISKVVQKCFATLVAINRFRHHFTPEALRLIIQSHVLPHVGYCLPAWGGANKTQLRRVQKAINFAARVVTGTRKRQHITPALRTLKWHNIETSIAEQDCLKICKAVYVNQTPAALKRMLIPRESISLRETRNSATQLQLPRCRLESTKRAFPYRAIAQWNALPQEILQTHKPNMIKKYFKETHSQD